MSHCYSESRFTFESGQMCPQDGASDLIHIVQAVLSYGGSISYFVDTVFNYPTLAEAYKTAALNGLKRVGVAALQSEEFAKPQGEASKEIATS